MTFLLFLASVAVMEYLVRDIGRKSPGQCPPEIRDAIEPNSLVNETPTADLLALGRALGMGKTTDSEQPPYEVAVSRESRPPAPLR